MDEIILSVHDFLDQVSEDALKFRKELEPFLREDSTRGARARHLDIELRALATDAAALKKTTLY